MKTVEVVALESRIKELERENDILRHEAGLLRSSSATIFSFVEDEAPRPIDISYQEVTLYRTAVWDVRRDWRTGQMHAVGSCKTSGPVGDDRLHITYYHEAMEGLPREAALDALGRLHERTVMQLANLWWQPAKRTT